MTSPGRKPNPLKVYTAVQLRYDRETRALLNRTAADVTRMIRRLSYTPGVGASVRRAQLQLVLREINEALAGTYRGALPDVITRGRAAAAEAAADASDVLDRVLYRGVGEPSADVLLRSAQEQARRGLGTDSVRVRRELSARVYRNYQQASTAIESTVRSGIIAGLSARELASEVFKYVSPTTPGGASYAAMRLSRTEINNAFHEQQVQSGQKPWVTGCKWNLSGSHPRPDACNDYAKADNGMGPGVYAAGNVPSKPHPLCLCYITYETLSPDAFVAELLAGRIAV